MRFVGNLSFINAGRALFGLPQVILSPPHEISSAPTVTIKNGTYAGVYNTQYDQDFFLGVPFAQPPERFSIAQGPNTSWDGVRQATEYSLHCYGYAGLKDTSGLPVAAWIHGGGLFMGGAANPRYNLSFIVNQSVALGTPVIGVSLNYRLSAFGFPTGKEALSEGVTNLGFRDQRLALRWINENIAAFGGDPDKVTIFGESSGAEGVAAQILAYNGRDDGLFRGAIAESGFGAPLDRFLVLENGRFNKVPILIGANTDEGASFGVGRRPNGGNVDTDDETREAIATIIPPEAEKNTGKTVSELVDELMEVYPNDQSIGIPSLDSWPHIIKPGDPYASQFGAQYRRSAALFGDHLMQYQRRRANKAWDKHGVPSYVYRFNIRPNGQPPHAGVGHFQEVAFVFNNIHGNGYPTNPFGGEGTYPADAKVMAKTISTAWINFFAGLNPNGNSGSKIFSGKEWPVYELSDGHDGKGVVFNINGTHVEVDNWRSGGMEWMAEHALTVFGN
ncbi:lipase 1 [Fusarium avenaceum]|nr:lipase 1 [Fusarium avenaceum]